MLCLFIIILYVLYKITTVATLHPYSCGTLCSATYTCIHHLRTHDSFVVVDVVHVLVGVSNREYSKAGQLLSYHVAISSIAKTERKFTCTI